MSRPVVACLRMNSLRRMTDDGGERQNTRQVGIQRTSRKAPRNQEVNKQLKSSLRHHANHLSCDRKMLLKFPRLNLQDKATLHASNHLQWSSYRPERGGRPVLCSNSVSCAKHEMMPRRHAPLVQQTVMFDVFSAGASLIAQPLTKVANSGLPIF